VLKLVSSASPFTVEVINFTQMEKSSCSAAPKGVCDGFLLVTNTRGGGPTCYRSLTFWLLPPIPALPYSAGLFCHPSFVIPHICAVRGRAWAPLTALAEALSSLMRAAGRSRSPLTMGTLCPGFCTLAGETCPPPHSERPVSPPPAVRRPDDTRPMLQTCR